jgi:MoxR-like ATPase
MIKLQNIRLDNRAANYLPSPELLNALEVAYMLKRPLLLTGEPGTGKTQFAFWVADALSKSDGFQPQPLMYNTKTSSMAQDLFYSYDAIAHFREGKEKKTEDFIGMKALGLAIANAKEGKGSVVLIDEIDKAPRDFPNDLLNEIENYEFEIREINQRIGLTEDSQKQKIIIILTSNFEKNLPDAFLRRCIYYHIDFPTKERLYEIVLRRLDLSPDDYGDIEKRVNDFFLFHRFPNISKRPSTSEFIDWIRVLHNDRLLSKDFFADGQLIIDEMLPKYLPILIKNKEDIGKILAK